ncbi:MAG: DNA methyltransferase [Acidimicrobiaceae bacterium]|nr:DNA methyltransferase [Acidimicrobiaceae bacterium]
MATDVGSNSTSQRSRRHLFIVDNYELLKVLNTSSVDLICTDPPFAKNETFVGGLNPPLTEFEKQREIEKLKEWGIENPLDAERRNVTWPTDEATAKFSDIWSWEADVHEQWINEIADTRPAVLNVIETTRRTHNEGTAAYLAYMAVRLIECRRILKPTGALYLHCDHTANSYLRLLLDAIFGRDNFRNDIIWSYRTGGVSKRYWPRKHDTLLFYVKSNKYDHNAVQERIYYDKPFFSTQTDEQGRHYADVFVRDVWEDIKPLINVSKERTGYPTQKPVALAERIIAASSNPGDLVFDPFAGCAYVPVAAENLARQWVACDISPRAMTVLRRQFKKFGYAVDGEVPDGVIAHDGVSLARAEVSILGPHELPQRTSLEEGIASVKPLPTRKYKVAASIFTRQEMLSFLLGLSGWRAWCCGFANWKTDSVGRQIIDQTTRNFELDHIDPQSKRGRHEIYNHAPLCPYHNGVKSDRWVPLDDLREEIAAVGDLAVASIGDLVDLAWARDQALEYWAEHRARQRLDH